MSVLPLRGPTVASALAEALRGELLSGAIAPGTALPEAELADRSGAPAGIVREALAELAHEGLVVHSLHRGMEVARITRDELHDIYVARRAYEGEGLRALMTRHPLDVSWLSAACERMGEAAIADDGRALVEADMAFHLALVAAAGSRRLTRAAQGALNELRLVLSVADRAADDMPAMVVAHQHIVDVIESGRQRAAVAALLEHLAHGEALARTAASER